ncbi:MAG: MBL fold metallo-hydrolase [Candidatus Sulfopaludibacter sp.]|nr:MBL fold metallo-hydrolase [Candidatus Sulfopaludibacter sp.]
MMLKLLLLTSLVVMGASAKTLTFYTIDVEGGKSVLVVSPSGESMLFDAGWPGSGNREASNERIVAALRGAGLKQLDYLVISHFDIDHLGDVPALAARFPIRHIMDHGPAQSPSTDRGRFNAYDELRKKIGHTVLKPGDKIPLKGVDIEVVTSAGRLLSKPLKGGGAANPLCATNPQAAAVARDVEDDQSIGVLFTFGKFRMLDLADLEAHLSHELVCPVNLVGTVDVYHVNVHGQFKGMAAELAGAIRPTVAIVGNGARKGADPQTWPILRATAGLEDIWQVHYSAAGTQDTNPPPDFIANLEQPADQFNMIRLTVQSNGTYTVTNTRNGFTRTYHAGMAAGKKK